MTPPGGSRDGGGDGGGGEPDDDPGLGAMRAVWREMRDEDPPDRGLADLLAAARSQAAAVQPRPNAWQRVLAVLRRPPVLALATVTVLIAGAVLIGRRVPDEAAPVPVTGDAMQPEPGGLALPAPGSSAGSSRSAGAAGPASAPWPARRPSPPPPEPPVPAGVPASHAIGGVTHDDDDRAAAASGPAIGAAPARPPSATAAELGAPPARRDVDPAGDTGAPTVAVRPARAAGGAVDAADRANTDAATDANEPATGAAPAVTAFAPVPASHAPRDATDDLVRQCESAARRGDCAAVRRLVGRITRTDPGYRARLARDSPVGNCLTD